jgi:DnaJ-class molecular chaperone
MSDLLIRDMLPAKVCPECFGSGEAPTRHPGERRRVCDRCQGHPVILIERRHLDTRVP